MPAPRTGAARSADLERQAGAEVVEVGCASESGAGMDGVLAEAGLDAAHDGVGVGFDPVAVWREPAAADSLDVPGADLPRPRLRRLVGAGGAAGRARHRGRRPQRVQAALAASVA